MKQPRAKKTSSSHGEPPAPVLTAEELRRFSDFLYRRTGMLFGENKRYYIERRIADLELS